MLDIINGRRNDKHCEQSTEQMIRQKDVLRGQVEGQQHGVLHGQVLGRQKRVLH